MRVYEGAKTLFPLLPIGIFNFNIQIREKEKWIPLKWKTIECVLDIHIHKYLEKISYNANININKNININIGMSYADRGEGKEERKY